MPERTLAATVFVTDLKTHETLLLSAGTRLTDSAIAEQITNPDAWGSEPYPDPEPQPRRSARRTKAAAQETEAS